MCSNNLCAYICECAWVSVCVNVQCTASEVFLFTVVAAASAVAYLLKKILLLSLTNHIWRLFFHVLCQNFVCECSRNQAKQNANWIEITCTLHIHTHTHTNKKRYNDNNNNGNNENPPFVDVHHLTPLRCDVIRLIHRAMFIFWKRLLSTYMWVWMCSWFICFFLCTCWVSYRSKKKKRKGKTRQKST